MTRAFDRMADEVYSTKRNATGTNQVTKAATNLATVLGTPLMPVDTEIVERYRIQSPRQHFVIYFTGTPDILAGDFVVHGADSLPVRGVGKWPSDRSYLEVVVEDIK